MTYSVQVMGINPDIEEEVRIGVNDIEIVCFSYYNIPKIEIGNFYNVDIGITILDDLEMEEVMPRATNFEQISNTFKYKIYGNFDLELRTIDAGIIIKFDGDEVNLYDYSYLDGKYVCATVDRIKAEFL